MRYGYHVACTHLTKIDNTDYDNYINEKYRLCHNALLNDKGLHACYNELVRINSITPISFVISKSGELLETIYNYSEYNKKYIKDIEELIQLRTKQIENYYLKDIK